MDSKTNNKKEIVINFDKLEKEVQKAVKADEKYWRENSAKFRAIEQRVPTYEDFRQIVLASHLKPLDKGETLQTVQAQKNWNLLSTNNKDESEQIKTTNDCDITQINPKTNLEFMQIWRKIGLDEVKQWQFITNIGVQKLIDLFMTEINGEILGKFLVLFNNKLKQNIDVDEIVYKNDCEIIVNLLNGLHKCNRFDLNLMFLQKKEIESCKNLFECLIEFYSKIETSFNNIDIAQLKCKFIK